MSLPNSPMNMLPFTKALRLPNNGFAVTDGVRGTRARNRSRSSSVAVSTFAAVFVDVLGRTSRERSVSRLPAPMFRRVDAPQVDVETGQSGHVMAWAVGRLR